MTATAITTLATRAPPRREESEQQTQQERIIIKRRQCRIRRKRPRGEGGGGPWRQQHRQRGGGGILVRIHVLAGVVLLVLLLVLLLPDSTSAQEVFSNTTTSTATPTTATTSTSATSSTLSPMHDDTTNTTTTEDGTGNSLGDFVDSSNLTTTTSTASATTVVPTPLPTPPPAPAPVLPPTTSYFSVTSWFVLMFDYVSDETSTESGSSSAAGFLNESQIISFNQYMEGLTQQFAEEEEWQKVVTMCNHLEITTLVESTQPPLFYNESTYASSLVVSSTNNSTEDLLAMDLADDTNNTTTTSAQEQQEEQQYLFEYSFQMIYLSSAVNVSLFPSRLEEYVNSPINLPQLTTDLQILLGLTNSSDLNITNFQEVPQPQGETMEETQTPTVPTSSTSPSTTTGTQQEQEVPVATISPTGYPTISVQPSLIPTVSTRPSLSPQPSNIPSIPPSDQPSTTPSDAPTMYPTFSTNLTVVDNFAIDFTLQAQEGAGYLNATQEEEFCLIMINQTTHFTEPPDPSIANRVRTICTFFSDTYVRTITEVPIPTFPPSKAPSTSSFPSTVPTAATTTIADDADDADEDADTRRGGPDKDKDKKKGGRHGRSLLSSLTSFLRMGRTRTRTTRTTKTRTKTTNTNTRRYLQNTYLTTIYTYTYTFRMRYISESENVTDYTNLFPQHIASNANEFNVRLTELLGLTTNNNLTLTSISVFETKSASPTTSSVPSQSPTELPTQKLTPLPSFAPTPSPSYIPTQFPANFDDSNEEGEGDDSLSALNGDNTTSSSDNAEDGSGGPNPDDTNNQTTLIIVVAVVALLATVIMVGMAWFYKSRRQTKLEQEAAQQRRSSNNKENGGSTRGGGSRARHHSNHHDYPYKKQPSQHDNGDPLGGHGSYHSSTGRGGGMGMMISTAHNTVATSPTTYAGDIEGFGGGGGMLGGSYGAGGGPGGGSTNVHRLMMSPSTSESILSNPSLLSNGQEEEDDDDDDDDVHNQQGEHDVSGDFGAVMQQRHQNQLTQSQLYAKLGPTIDELDQFKDQNLEKMRSNVEDSVKGIDGMMSQALTMAILSGTNPNALTSSGRALVMEGEDGIEIEANALCEVTDFVKKHASSRSSGQNLFLDERHSFMQDILNKMVTSVRQGIMGPDEASRTIHECAALLKLQLSTELPNTTVILTGMRKNVRANDVIRTFRKFGPIEDAAVASKQRGFGFVRFKSSKTVEQVMMKFRTHEIVVQDVAVQCRRLKPDR